MGNVSLAYADSAFSQCDRQLFDIEQGFQPACSTSQADLIFAVSICTEETVSIGEAHMCIFKRRFHKSYMLRNEYATVRFSVSDVYFVKVSLIKSALAREMRSADSTGLITLIIHAV